LLPEQVWDEQDWPEEHLCLGRPTGAAVPLLWAHAEYLRLLRSRRDGKVFNLIPEVAERYLQTRQHCRRLKVWSFRYPAAVVRPGHALRLLADKPFRLHWSPDGWGTVHDTIAQPTRLRFYFVDILVPEGAREPLRFTFFWSDEGRWEGRDFSVAIET
jgi:glucoamylase